MAAKFGIFEGGVSGRPLDARAERAASVYGNCGPTGRWRHHIDSGTYLAMGP